MRRLTAGMAVLAVAIGLGWFASRDASEEQRVMAVATKTIHIKSPAFAPGHAIPQKYTGEGADVSPPLDFSDVPAETKELVLIVDDPDAPMAEPFVHWVAYGISADTRNIPENASASGAFAQGRNDFGKVGYGGPMPPKKHGVHHYHFKLYALDKALPLPDGKSKAQVLKAMSGHVLAEGELVGTYERK